MVAKRGDSGTADEGGATSVAYLQAVGLSATIAITAAANRVRETIPIASTSEKDE
jgi:hypothetical protein